MSFFVELQPIDLNPTAFVERFSSDTIVTIFPSSVAQLVGTFWEWCHPLGSWIGELLDAQSYSYTAFLSQSSASQTDIGEGSGSQFWQPIHPNLWNRNLGGRIHSPLAVCNSWGLNSTPPLTHSTSVIQHYLLLLYRRPLVKRKVKWKTCLIYVSLFVFFALVLSSRPTCTTNPHGLRPVGQRPNIISSRGEKLIEMRLKSWLWLCMVVEP